MRDFLLGAPGENGHKRGQIFLFGIVVAQIFLAWFMGTLADWSTHTEFEMMDVARHIVTDNPVAEYAG
eukprot:CAMPEP_0117017660 /NCGR_PEP_ID=MMETSP0472-20121206/13760_1 /TAXON_ID=693140 ORGANISM="Tiarina fusus, Strain LIS" /NCGR_SAMPLE_ID=MMETSP0472 /ASSEMBLY_ACC=CAM_ASM_000603 /LENGTH=67 /DNA_ID=CAMNT_0004722091 /DNA_START=671 /DNA_END=870 /DNA_ORIENTATION=-